MKSDFLFMNISTDQVIISDGDDDIFLHRNDVEKTLGPKLVQIVRDGGYKNIIVLNGPGGFTNLRVGTLCLNVLNSVMKNQISFFDISKIDLYKNSYDKGILPKYGIIYIGQKRNIWLRNFEKNEKIGQYSFDELKDLDEMKDIEKIFIDSVEDESYYPEWMDKFRKMNISFDGNNLIMKYGEASCEFSLEDLSLQELKSIAPNYMMDPNISMPNK